MSRLATLLACIACAACGGTPTAPTPEVPGFVTGISEVFVGAGDIAVCGSTGTELTARLLDGIPGTVFTLGDNAYYAGTREEFRNCYDPTWGRHKSRTRPTPGNHEYESSGASPYFAYFGASAGQAGRGYYSFQIGDWFAVALNSNIPAGSTSSQGQWLRGELASRKTLCTIAYWHHPLFSSGPHGGTFVMRDIWRILYEFNADIIMSGHEHFYERFALQTPDGGLDPIRGIRQFIVGTGGAPLYGFPTVHPHSEARDSTHGVLKLTLNSDSYQWQFLTASGTSDIGTGVCH